MLKFYSSSFFLTPKKYKLYEQIQFISLIRIFESSNLRTSPSVNPLHVLYFSLLLPKSSKSWKQVRYLSYTNRANK